MGFHKWGGNDEASQEAWCESFAKHDGWTCPEWDASLCFTDIMKECRCEHIMLDTTLRL
jgi:hypothetical protein